MLLNLGRCSPLSDDGINFLKVAVYLKLSQKCLKVEAEFLIWQGRYPYHLEVYTS
jgi:hypothetical protein